MAVEVRNPPQKNHVHVLDWQDIRDEFRIGAKGIPIAYLIKWPSIENILNDYYIGVMK